MYKPNKKIEEKVEKMVKILSELTIEDHIKVIENWERVAQYQKELLKGGK